MDFVPLARWIYPRAGKINTGMLFLAKNMLITDPHGGKPTVLQVRSPLKRTGKKGTKMDATFLSKTHDFYHPTPML